MTKKQFLDNSTELLGEEGSFMAERLFKYYLKWRVAPPKFAEKFQMAFALPPLLQISCSKALFKVQHRQYKFVADFLPSHNFCNPGSHHLITRMFTISLSVCLTTTKTAQWTLESLSSPQTAPACLTPRQKSGALVIMVIYSGIHEVQTSPVYIWPSGKSQVPSLCHKSNSFF